MGKVSFWASAVLSLCSMAVFSSCCGSARRVDAMIDKDGNPAGVIVEYRCDIDAGSLDADSYQVPGQTVSMVFASNSNPFGKGSRKDAGSVEKNGRYVVVLLKGNPGSDIRIKQVAPVKTVSGKTVNPWKKSIKAKDLFEI